LEPIESPEDTEATVTVELASTEENIEAFYRSAEPGRKWSTATL